jgi:ABC-type sugar transport system permease subunit
LVLAPAGALTLPGRTFFAQAFPTQILTWCCGCHLGLDLHPVWNAEYGLRALGLDALTHSWLGDFKLAMPSVGSIGTWEQYAFCMILFLEGMHTS